MTTALSLLRRIAPCWLLHDWGPWRVTAEVPIWDSGLSIDPRCLGKRPEKLYRNGVVAPDLDYVLTGKKIEQRRTCSRCGLTQIRATEWRA